MKKLMVIDGNSIVNRAFYGVSQSLTTREGQPTNAIFGFLNILNKLLEEEKPEGLAVAFDMRAPTFRHKMYDGYKAQRKGMPEELAQQMPVLKEVLDAMNIRRYELEGWEADDLIGTIAAIDEREGWETVIVTGDKDSLQLVNEYTTVKLVTSRMGQTTTRDMTPEAFREEYGFEPIHIIDLKALMGDSSDNIPGVKGIGEKTAMGLVQLYGSIDHLYDHMPDFGARGFITLEQLAAYDDAAADARAERQEHGVRVHATDAEHCFAERGDVGVVADLNGFVYHARKLFRKRDFMPVQIERAIDNTRRGIYCTRATDTYTYKVAIVGVGKRQHQTPYVVDYLVFARRNVGNDFALFDDFAVLIDDARFYGHTAYINADTIHTIPRLFDYYSVYR